MRELLKSLPERKRRTFIRYMNKSATDPIANDAPAQKEDILNKLNALKVADDNDDDDDSSSLFDDGNLESSSDET